MTKSRRTQVQPLAHIRREDECEITFCDLLTAVCIDPQDTAPIAVVGSRQDIAIYADVDIPSGYTTCPKCYHAYMAL